jgi:hypothetical protein
LKSKFWDLKSWKEGCLSLVHGQVNGPLWRTRRLLVWGSCSPRLMVAWWLYSYGSGASSEAFLTLLPEVCMCPLFLSHHPVWIFQDSYHRLFG